MEPWENLPLRYNAAASSWSARFTCYLKLHCGGAPQAKYTFRLESGNKGKLFIGGANPRNPRYSETVEGRRNRASEGQITCTTSLRTVSRNQCIKNTFSPAFNGNGVWDKAASS